MDTALVILDMINLFDFEDGDRLARSAAGIAPHIARLRARFDAVDGPVIYVNDNFSHWHDQFGDLVAACVDAGGRAARIAATLAPRPHDYHVLKPKHSGFLATPLAVLLAKLQVGRLVLAGISADSCVLATAQEANMREYPVWCPADCVGAISAHRKRLALKLIAGSLNGHVDASADVAGIFPGRMADARR